MVLLENPYLKLIPNFCFNCKKTKLKEFEPLSLQVDPNLTHIKIDLIQEAFNDRTARQHISNAAEFFENPKHFIYQGFLEFNTLLGKNEYLQNALTQKREPPMFNNDLNAILNSDLTTLQSLSLFGNENKTNDAYFFNSLSYSKNNPPLGKGKVQGDIFYLDLVTLENQSYCLTVNKSGLFINGGGKQEFSCKPESQIYMSLLELISSLSSQFKTHLEQFYDIQNPSLYQKYQEQFELTKPLDHSSSKWLKELPKDWNEEYQNSKTLLSSDSYQQIQKIKLLKKTNSDFINASCELTKAIINDSIIPLNPSENTVENCYVFNNLFATYALDSLDWELPKTDSSPSTYTTINNDLKNLKTLFELEIEGINTINTCTVEYLGRRIIVQTVIQGILHFDQNTWNCYGTIDDGKTMTWNKEFHHFMGQICEKFNLTLENEFLDAEQKKFLFNGSPEVKGIKAGDGRSYIMDLMRLSPRDANYTDSKIHECCVLRPELIKSFFYFQNVQNMYQNQMKLQKEKSKLEEQKQSEIKDIQDQDKIEQNNEEKTIVVGSEVIEKNIVEKQNEEKNVINDKSVDQQQTDQKEQNKVLQDSSQTITQLNPSLLTQIVSCNENQEKEMDNLKQVSKFLKENVISAFINNMSSNPSIMPMDMEGLVDSMHKNGINLRYLGYIHSQLKNTQNHYFMKLIERTVFVRAFVKILRKIALELNSETIISLFIRFTNIFLGNKTVREIIDGVNNTQGNQKNIDENANIKIKTKKNKKKKKKKQKTDIQHLLVKKDSPYFKMNSQEFFDELKIIVEARYGFQVDEGSCIDNLPSLKHHQNKITFLRELCLHFGVQIKPRKYCFEQSKNNFDMPINLNDITGTFTKNKSASYYQDILKFNNKSIENEISGKNFQGALQLLYATQNIIINTYGIYNKDFIFNCSKIATILFQLKEFDQSISVQTFVIQLSEIVYGLDHFNTAYAILELSNFLFEKKKIDQCIQLHQASLFIFDLIGSIFNSNSFFCLHELQVLMNDKQNNSETKILIEQLLERNAELFGQTDERLLYFLDKLASIKAEEDDFEQASLLQARHSLILGRVLKNSSHLNDQYKQTLQMKLSESEKYKKQYMSKRMRK